MTKTFHALRLVASTLCAFAIGGQAAGQIVGSLKIEHAWVRPMPRGAPTAAGYVTITNKGRTPDRLTGATTKAAASIEIHQTSMMGSVMRMRPVPGGVDLPAGQTVSLDPGGYHLMFIGPSHTFRAGEHIIVDLRFTHAPAARTDFIVQEPSSRTGAMPGMTMHSGGQM